MNISTKRIKELGERVSLNPALDAIVVDNGSEAAYSTIATLKAEVLNNASLTGVPTAPKPNPGDDTTRLATTEWVQDELGSLGLTAATATGLGTVRTDVTETVPIVYTKASVDLLLDAERARLTAVEAANTAQDTSLTSLSNRVTALEGLSAGSRLTALEQWKGRREQYFFAFYNNLTAPNGTAQFITGTGGNENPTASQAIGAFVSTNTVVQLPTPSTGTAQWLIHYHALAIHTGATANLPTWFRVNLALNVNAAGWNTVQGVGYNSAAATPDRHDSIAQAGHRVVSVDAGQTIQVRVMKSCNATASSWSGITVHLFGWRVN